MREAGQAIGPRDLPRATRATGPAHGLIYRPDIDGLRTIAVVPVVLYHTGIAPFGGGFVGVDIFLVISGYLIMSTLAGDMRQHRFSILQFYERRIRRIFPALFAMLAFCLLAGAIIFPPDSFERFGHAMVAVALFVSNVVARFDGGPAGYFDKASDTQLLLHTWSLAVEEQFYVVLPIVLWLLRRRDPAITRIVLTLACIASFSLSIHDVATRPLDAFYLMVPRAWEFLVGSLLALGVVPTFGHRAGREAASLIGLGLIAVAVFTYSRQTPFPGAHALLPCLGAGLILHAGDKGPTLVGRLLATPPMVSIGRRSYSLYLWHWPFVVLVIGLDTGLLNAASTALILALSAAAAALSYRFVEQPFRTGRARLARTPLFVAAFSVSLVAVLCGGAIVRSHGLPQRFDAATRTELAANLAREDDHDKGTCQNWRTDVHTIADIEFCSLGDESQRKILFWGDSHMGVLRPVIATLYAQGALGALGGLYAIAAKCTPSVSMDRREDGYHCAAFSRLAIERAKAADIATVFLAFSAGFSDIEHELCRFESGRCTGMLSRQEERDLFIADLADTLRALRAADKRVIIALPIPTYNLMIPQMEINRIVLGAPYRALQDLSLLRPLVRQDYMPLRTRIAQVAKDYGATLYDPRADLCTGDTCLYARGNVAIYADNSHVGLSQTGIFEDSLRRVLH